MTAEPEPLLHLIGAAQWRVALDAGAVVDASLVTDGYIHLSGPEQVALPAERFFPAREDLLVLVVDRARLRDEVRWEPGVPESMRFPHLFGPLPVAAVTASCPTGRGRRVCSSRQSGSHRSTTLWRGRQRSSAALPNGVLWS